MGVGLFVLVAVAETVTVALAVETVTGRLGCCVDCCMYRAGFGCSNAIQEIPRVVIFCDRGLGKFVPYGTEGVGQCRERYGLYLTWVTVDASLTRAWLRALILFFSFLSDGSKVK